MKKIAVVLFIIAILVSGGCKTGEKADAKKAFEEAENVIHYRNVLGIRDIALRSSLIDNWGNKEVIDEAYGGMTYELLILDPAPLDRPSVNHVPNGWEEMPFEIVYYEKLKGGELISNLERLVERGDGGGSWGHVEVVSGHPIKEETVLDGSWVVPFIFVHDQMVAPLSGSGAIFRLDVILDNDFNLISVIATGGQTWIS